MRKQIQSLLGKRATDDFMDFLDNIGYFECPAAKSHHGNYEGGLVAHSVEVAKQLTDLTTKLNLQWNKPESPWVIGLLHDICKTDDYVYKFYTTYSTADGFVNKKDIEYNDTPIYPGHGIKSVIILGGRFELTEEEKMCIAYHMGSFTDKEEWKYYSNAIKMCPNVLYTHMADMIASQIKGV